MSTNRYFDDIRIPANSPLVEHLNIKPGNYSGKLDATQGKLLLKQKGSDQILSLSVTLDELVAILMMVKRDKFTSEELGIIQKIRRSSSFSGSRISPAHHVVPLDVCKNSKLIIQAKRCGFFDENGNVNRRPLPLYFHKGSHPKYSRIAEDLLEERWDDLVEAEQEEDCSAVQEVLIEIIDFLNNTINKMLASGICTIDDV
jgi:hypothetical protein